jgi:hypothetical protein
MLREPNWDEIYDIAKRAEQLHGAGRMDRETWMDLLNEAHAAANGNADVTDFLAKYAKPEWLRSLLEPETPRRKSVA